MKKLTRNLDNKMICGVCSGLGDYLNIDPTVIRLLWILFGCMGGGIIAYIIAAVLIPAGPSTEDFSK